MWKDTLQEMNQGKKVRTYAAWALLILAPWIQLAVISLVLGKNALATYPVWSDELDYWRNLFCWVNGGFTQGYNGISEYAAPLGTLSVHGFIPILLYGGWVKLFGLTHYSIVLCNAVWVSVAAAVFCGLLRPKAWIASGTAGLLMLFVPAVLYASTSMTELFNYAILLLYVAFLVRSENGGGWWARVLCWVLVVFACLYRITYFVLFLPLLVKSGLSKKTIGLALLALTLTLCAYGVGVAFTAPYPAGFLYNWMRAENFGIFVKMFFSHAKSNLFDYFIRHTDSPMEDGLRLMYCGAMAWTFLASFIRLEREEGRIRLEVGLRWKSVNYFLLLFVPFAIVIMLYETNDWSDFRTLSPFLWSVAILMLLQRKRILPAFVLAGSIAMLVGLCNGAPIGAFQDEYRFTEPPSSAEVQLACEIIIFNPDAKSPYENTIRADLATYQVMKSVDPAMGLMFGWFTAESTGKSHWVLTDHLKIVLENYEAIFVDRGAKVYRKMADIEP